MMIWRAFKSHIDLLKKVNEISGYVSKWLQFQSLWYLEADYLYSQLGKSLSAWQQILSEIRKTRLNFDNSESFQDFGRKSIGLPNPRFTKDEEPGPSERLNHPLSILNSVLPLVKFSLESEEAGLSLLGEAALNNLAGSESVDVTVKDSAGKEILEDELDEQLSLPDVKSIVKGSFDTEVSEEAVKHLGPLDFNIKNREEVDFENLAEMETKNDAAEVKISILMEVVRASDLPTASEEEAESQPDGLEESNTIIPADFQEVQKNFLLSKASRKLHVAPLKVSIHENEATLKEARESNDLVDAQAIDFLENESGGSTNSNFGQNVAKNVENEASIEVTEPSIIQSTSADKNLNLSIYRPRKPNERIMVRMIYRISSDKLGLGIHEPNDDSALVLDSNTTVQNHKFSDSHDRVVTEELPIALSDASSHFQPKTSIGKHDGENDEVQVGKAELSYAIEAGDDADAAIETDYALKVSEEADQNTPEYRDNNYLTSNNQLDAQTSVPGEDFTAKESLEAAQDKRETSQVTIEVSALSETESTPTEHLAITVDEAEVNEGQYYVRSEKSHAQAELDFQDVSEKVTFIEDVEYHTVAKGVELLSATASIASSFLVLTSETDKVEEILLFLGAYI
ncbi:hypothetical protein BY996DRAFT_6425243 [Phakopsora pachyrhizi]|nr:hypothetical protein BY996DRAFT_6425243 [Phakopsora pachyrhizi]